MAKKTVLHAIKMCAVEAQDRPLRSLVSLAMRSAIGNILDERFVAGHMQRAAMRADLRSSMIQAFSDAPS